MLNPSHPLFTPSIAAAKNSVALIDYCLGLEADTNSCRAIGLSHSDPKLPRLLSSALERPICPTSSWLSAAAKEPGLEWRAQFWAVAGASANLVRLSYLAEMERLSFEEAFGFVRWHNALYDTILLNDCLELLGHLVDVLEQDLAEATALFICNLTIAAEMPAPVVQRLMWFIAASSRDSLKPAEFYPYVKIWRERRRDLCNALTPYFHICYSQEELYEAWNSGELWKERFCMSTNWNS